MNPRVLIIIGFFAAVGGVFYLARRGNGSGDTGSTGPESSGPSQPVTPREVTEIFSLYSTKKKDWVESAAASFQQENPSIKVNLEGKGSLDAA
jgi:ABC-type glycerol-3-phosphate transport system substrate-binding protein